MKPSLWDLHEFSGRLLFVSLTTLSVYFSYCFWNDIGRTFEQKVILSTLAICIEIAKIFLFALAKRQGGWTSLICAVLGSIMVAISIYATLIFLETSYNLKSSQQTISLDKIEQIKSSLQYEISIIEKGIEFEQNAQKTYLEYDKPTKARGQNKRVDALRLEHRDLVKQLNEIQLMPKDGRYSENNQILTKIAFYTISLFVDIVPIILILLLVAKNRNVTEQPETVSDSPQDDPQDRPQDRPQDSPQDDPQDDLRTVPDEKLGLTRPVEHRPEKNNRLEDRPEISQPTQQVKDRSVIYPSFKSLNRPETVSKTVQDCPQDDLQTDFETRLLAGQFGNPAVISKVKKLTGCGYAKALEKLDFAVKHKKIKKVDDKYHLITEQKSTKNKG